MSFNVFNPKTYGVLSYLDRIKLLMMTMMSTGHIAWAFVPTQTTLGQALHFFARPTVMLACCLVVEGFTLSKNTNAYAKRLLTFGLLAQIPYMMALVGIWFLVYNPLSVLFQINVLFTLYFCLLSLTLCQKIQLSQDRFKQIGYGFLIICLMTIAYLFNFDWGYPAILWTIGIYYKRLFGFVAVSAVLFILSLISDNAFLNYVFSDQPMDYGLLLAILIIYWYDKNKHHSPKNYRLPRTLFYWYYVLHLLILGLLVQFSPYAVDEYQIILNQDGTYKNP